MALSRSLDRNQAPVNEGAGRIAVARRIATAMVVAATVLPIAWAMEVLARWAEDAPLVAAVTGLRVAATVGALSLLLVAAAGWIVSHREEEGGASRL